MSGSRFVGRAVLAVARGRGRGRTATGCAAAAGCSFFEALRAERGFAVTLFAVRVTLFFAALTRVLFRAGDLFPRAIALIPFAL